MNILITGAGGFIGTHLTKTLERNHKVIRVYSSSTFIERKHSISLDLTDNSAVNKLIDWLSKQTKIDTVIHLAFKMASPDRINDVELLTKNIEITKNVISVAKAINTRVFINFSSIAVYPNISGSFSEISLPEPQKNTDCLYGLSKYCSEVMINFLLRNENTRIVHLRIAQVHGKGMQKNRIIPIMLQELKEKNIITVYGNGRRESNFIEINKLIKFTQFFIDKELAGTFNVGDKNISYDELAQKLINEFGNRNSTLNKLANGNKERFKLDTSKLKALIKPNILD